MTRLLSIIAGFVLLFAVPFSREASKSRIRRLNATAPGMTATGGYLGITNHGDADDALVSASAGFAARVELHEMIMDGDVMRMRQHEGGMSCLPAAW